MSHLVDYLRAVHAIHATGAGTDETSYYPPLANLFNEIGDDQDPPVRCVMQVNDHPQEWLTGSKSDVFPLVKDRFSYLRRFAPTLFEKLEFSAEPTENRDLTEAMKALSADVSRGVVGRVVKEVRQPPSRDARHDH